MNDSLRKEALKKIIEARNPIETGIPLPFKGGTNRFDSYKIPLNCLVYNKKNGRISSRVKSYEKQYEEINSESFEGKKLIEKFLWQAHMSDNKNTENSIVKNGQLVRGVVTSKGIIVDGNRRASILNKIYSEREKWEKQGKKDVDFAEYFIAIILPPDVTKEEVEKIETSLQMGDEDKVDYNPIEKYLKVKDLESSGLSPFDIAKLMGRDHRKINEYQNIMTLMEDYLSYFNYDGIYTQLDRREDLFIGLYNALKSYRQKTSKVKWNYGDLDIHELKCIAFDYIRNLYEGKSFRNIIHPGKDSIFCRDKRIWESFKESHFNKIESIKESLVNECLDENVGEDAIQVLRARDEDWGNQVKIDFVENVSEGVSKIQDLNNANEPEKLIGKAKSSIEAMNVEGVEPFKKKFIRTQLDNLVKLINDKIKNL